MVTSSIFLPCLLNLSEQKILQVFLNLQSNMLLLKRAELWTRSCPNLILHGFVCLLFIFYLVFINAYDLFFLFGGLMNSLPYRLCIVKGNCILTSTYLNSFLLANYNTVECMLLCT